MSKPKPTVRRAPSFVKRREPPKPRSSRMAYAERYVIACETFTVVGERGNIKNEEQRRKAYFEGLRTIHEHALLLIASFDPSDSAEYFIVARGRLLRIRHAATTDDSFCEIVDDPEPVAPTPTRWQRIGYRVQGAMIRTRQRFQRFADLIYPGDHPRF